MKKEMYNKELAQNILEAPKSQDLAYPSWRLSKFSSSMRSESQCRYFSLRAGEDKLKYYNSVMQEKMV
jgi:hypothetical protein